MPTRARSSVLYDGCYAHVFTRSIEVRHIMNSDEEMDLYSGMLYECKRRYGFKIFHYCLMHTHFHMAAGIGSLEQFSAGLKWLKCEYTKAYNRTRKRRGTVWQGRYKALVIEDESYLRACGLYIERNPVEAGLVMHARDWFYSSSRCYELGEEDSLVDRYEWGGVLPLSAEAGKESFERGTVIGSEFHKLAIKDNLY